jgi:hypothetical protein
MPHQKPPEDLEIAEKNIKNQPADLGSPTSLALCSLVGVHRSGSREWSATIGYLLDVIALLFVCGETL